MSCENQLAQLDKVDWDLVLHPHDLPKVITVDESCQVNTVIGTDSATKEVVGCVQTIPFPYTPAYKVDCSALKDPTFEISGTPTCKNSKKDCGCGFIRDVWHCNMNPVRHLYYTPARCEEKKKCNDNLVLGGGGTKLRDLNNLVVGKINEWCNLSAELGNLCSKPKSKYKLKMKSAQIVIDTGGEHNVRCSCSGKSATVPFTLRVTGYVDLAKELLIPAICTANSSEPWANVAQGLNIRDACGAGVTGTGPNTPATPAQTCSGASAFFCCPKQNLTCEPAVGVFKRTKKNTPTKVYCDNDCDKQWYYDTYGAPFPPPTTLAELCDMEQNGCLKGGYHPNGGCSSKFTSPFRASDLIGAMGSLGSFAGYAMSTLFSQAAWEASNVAKDKVGDCKDGPMGETYLVNETSFDSADGVFSWADKPASLGDKNMIFSYTVDGKTFGPYEGSVF